MTHKQTFYIAATLLLTYGSISHADVMPTASMFCPLAKNLSIAPAPNDNPSCTGRWQGQNGDGHHFESQAAYPCTGNIISLNDGKTEVIDSYKIKCTYNASDAAGSKYSVILYNEHDYQLCPNKKIIGANDNCDE